VPLKNVTFFGTIWLIITMKEEQLEELEALKAIYMDDFFLLENQKNTKYAIQIIPHFEGNYQNQLTLHFEFIFPEDYPNVPFGLEHINIKFSKPFSPELVRELREYVVRSSDELIGTPMVYNLIEKLKEYLEQINPILNEGAIIALSDESIMTVFEYLSPDDLGWVACVNKNWKRISEDSRLWREFCLAESEKFAHLKLTKGETLDTESLELDWKSVYLNMMHRRISEMMFVSPIMIRRGTGDEWPSHIISWTDFFPAQFKKHYFSLSKGHIMHKNPWTGETALCGHYRLLSKQKGDFLFGKSEWVPYVRSLVTECPYLGEIAGYFLFTPLKNLSASLLTAVMQECRSVVARVHDSQEYIPSVHFQRILIGEVLNRTPQETETIGLLSNPLRVTSVNLYLTDLVNYINRKISFAGSKEEVGSKEKKKKKIPIKQFIEYKDRAGKMYPFKFEHYEYFGSLLSRTWLKVWIYNSISNALQGDFRKKLDVDIDWDVVPPSIDESDIQQ